MSPWAYLVQTAGWCGVGFGAGFVVGRTARDVHRIADAVTEGGTVDEFPVDRRTWWKRDSTLLVVALVVVALGVLTIVQGVIQSAATRRVVECHKDYADRLADVIEARSNGSQQAQEALDELMTTIGRLAASPATDEADMARRREESRLAISTYVAKRAHLKEVQATHPYPPPPREVCVNT